MVALEHDPITAKESEKPALRKMEGVLNSSGCKGASSYTRPLPKLVGPDGDEIIIRREPVHHVQEQVAIAIEAQNIVRHPVGAAHHHKAALLRGRLHRAGGGDGQRTFLILLRIDADFR